MLLYSTHYMAQIKINKEKFVEGRFTVKQKLVESENLVPDENGNMVPQQKVVIAGMFTTHDYIEELDTIESERYLIRDINVYEETFGSNDYEISYEFVAGSLTVKEDYIPEMVDEIFEGFKYTAKLIAKQGELNKTKHTGTNCSWCDYKQICYAELTGGNVEYVKKKDFEGR